MSSHRPSLSGRCCVAGSVIGLSVLIWQHVIGIELHWMVLAMSVIILLAVGADYNLLLVSRLKEEIHAGVNTGIIRAMAAADPSSPQRVWCSPSR